MQVAFQPQKIEMTMQEFQSVDDWQKKYKIISKIEDSRFVYSLVKD